MEAEMHAVDTNIGQLASNLVKVIQS